MKFTEKQKDYMLRQFLKIEGKPNGLQCRYLASQINGAHWSDIELFFLTRKALSSRLTVDVTDYQGEFAKRGVPADLPFGLQSYDVRGKKGLNRNPYTKKEWAAEREFFSFEVNNDDATD